MLKYKIVLLIASIMSIFFALLIFVHPMLISKGTIDSISIRQYKENGEYDWLELDEVKKEQLETILLEMDLRRMLEARKPYSASNNPIQLEVVSGAKVLYIVLGENNNIVNVKNKFEQYKIINGKDIYSQIKGIIE